MKTLIQGLVAVALVNGGAAFAQDATRGEKLFNECAAFHSPDRAAKDTVGPSLHGVVGRKAGEGTEFRYSPAMKRSGITWSSDTLNSFISDPQKLVPGMVLTVEPGTYIRPADNVPEAFWNIGVRIEDDVLVTAGGCEILNHETPKSIADIEALMRG